MGSSSLVENQSLPQPNSSKAAIDDLITASGLPKSGCGCTICSSSRRIFLIFMTKEVPIILWGGSNLTFLYKGQTHRSNKVITKIINHDQLEGKTKNLCTIYTNIKSEFFFLAKQKKKEHQIRET